MAPSLGLADLFRMQTTAAAAGAGCYLSQPGKSEQGTTLFINELRLPGTFQEFKLRRGIANLWVDTSQIQSIRFYGPEHDRYRRADIFFMDGHKMQADVFVDVLLEGTAKGLYWNMPMSRVQQLQFGTQ